MTRAAWMIAILLVLAASIARAEGTGMRSIHPPRAGSVDTGAAQAKKPAAPRLGIAGGVLFPASNGYFRETRLTSLRLFLRQGRERLFLEVGIPFAGIAWSGGIVPSEGEARAVDWTLVDLFVGRTLTTGNRPAHLGAGIGLHRLNFTTGDRVRPQWAPASKDCGGDCGGSVDGLVMTGDAGVGARLTPGESVDLTLMVRFRATLLPVDAADDTRAEGIIAQLAAIF